MLLIFLGAPGSGKGTQSKIISEICSMSHISTGDLLRWHINNKTKMGLLVSDKISAGQFVDDEIVNNMVLDALSIASPNGAILDGYPRTLEQARFLERFYKDYTVFLFDIKLDNLSQRILGRFMCANCKEIYNKFFNRPDIDGICNKCASTDFISRNDDNEGTLLARLNKFSFEIEPLIEFYRSAKKVNIIDASMDKTQITSNILSALKSA